MWCNFSHLTPDVTLISYTYDIILNPHFRFLFHPVDKNEDEKAGSQSQA